MPRGNPKTEARIYAELICSQNRKMSDNGLATLLQKQRPDLYTTHEKARDIVRLIHGKHGAVKLKELGDKSLVKPLNPLHIDEVPEEYIAAQKRKLTKSKFYIVTYAQNNTPVHTKLLRNIEAYAKYLGASIHVVLGRYKNPTSIFTDSDKECWDERILQYADANRHNIHKYLTILGDVKIQPTAVSPLNDKAGMAGINSGIFAHPKVQMTTVAALDGYKTKMFFTTGALTLPNYTDSNAGKKSEFHHTFGFVIVEIKDSEIFFIRQVTATTDGSFYDLYHKVLDQKVSLVNNIEAAILGDIHVGEDCKQVNKSQRKLLDRLKPKHTLIHDIFNGHSVSHHELKDPIKQYEREVNGSNSLATELANMKQWVKSMLKYNLVFVASNHNDWLDRHIKDIDWKKNIKNSREYVKGAEILLSGKAPKGLVAYYLQEEFGNKVKTLGRNDSFKVKNWELSQHGDVAINGTKGGLVSFRRLSTKIIIGHSHTPARIDGVIQVGTSTLLRVDYNKGASSWANCDAIIHPNGKAQMIIYVGDKKEYTTL